MIAGGERERKILDAAVSLFGERSPELVTMEEVARRAGVAKGTLYTYFPSKDDMVRKLLDSRLDRLLEGLRGEASRSGDAWTRLRRAVDVAFRIQVDAADWFRMQRRVGPAPDNGQPSGRRGELRETLRRLILSAGRTEAQAGRDADLILGAVGTTVQRCIDARPRPAEAEADALWSFVRRALGGGRMAGRTVLVTRDEEENGALACALKEHDARALPVPLLETLPPEDPEALTREAERLADFDWVVVTSARAVDALAAVAPSGRPSSVRFAAVGAATAERLRKHGLAAAATGSEGGEDLARELAGSGGALRGKRVLFPTADRARPETVVALERAGAVVQRVTAYRTVLREDAAARLAEALRSEAVDAVTFTSPSAVEAFREACPQHALPPVAAVIGATTARVAETLGFAQLIVAGTPGFVALADALARNFETGASE
ncbi:MAG TPA: uroporphyrinogen-III synthase [bacterium]|nr:uroporphyrinogen-III synthase [bacterium]